MKGKKKRNESGGSVGCHKEICSPTIKGADTHCVIKVMNVLHGKINFYTI